MIFVPWIAFGVVLGLGAGLAVLSFAPRRYVARAVVASDEAAGQRIHLAGVHARMIRRLYPAPRFPAGWEAMREGTLLCTGPQGVEITSGAASAEDALITAREAARLYRGMDAERRLAGSDAPIRPFDGDDQRKLVAMEAIRGSLSQLARQEGFPDFSDVTRLAAEGSREARMLLLSMSFTPKIEELNAISTELNLEELNAISTELNLDVAPGEPLTPAWPLVAEAKVAAQPILPQWSEWLAVFCRIAGVGLGIAGAFRFGYRRWPYGW